MKRVYMCAFLIVLGCVLSLAGCTGDIDNVEQRDYATLMMISLPESGGGYHYVIGTAKEHYVGEKGEAESVFETDAGSVEELKKIYREHKGKELSLAHLKAILTAVNYEKGLMNKVNGHDNANRFIELLYELDGQDEIAKTCPLLLVMDRFSIAEYVENADRPVGTYISDLVRNAKRNDRKVPKLLNYLKMLREGSSIDMYSIEREGEDMVLHLQRSY